MKVFYKNVFMSKYTLCNYRDFLFNIFNREFCDYITLQTMHYSIEQRSKNV